jgi:hypothetical protein
VRVARDELGEVRDGGDGGDGCDHAREHSTHV